MGVIRTSRVFDSRYTAPVHGFASEEEYWARASCLPVLSHIERPSLLVNAANDPFLSPACYPVSIAKNHPYLYLEIPAQGGHVGFSSRVAIKEYWSETRTIDFFREQGFMD